MANIWIIFHFISIFISISIPISISRRRTPHQRQIPERRSERQAQPKVSVARIKTQKVNLPSKLFSQPKPSSLAKLSCTSALLQLSHLVLLARTNLALKVGRTCNTLFIELCLKYKNFYALNTFIYSSCPCSSRTVYGSALKKCIFRSLRR